MRSVSSPDVPGLSAAIVEQKQERMIQVLSRELGEAYADEMRRGTLVATCTSVFGMEAAKGRGGGGEIFGNCID